MWVSWNKRFIFFSNITWEDNKPILLKQWNNATSLNYGKRNSRYSSGVVGEFGVNGMNGWISIIDLRGKKKRRTNFGVDSSFEIFLRLIREIALKTSSRGLCQFQTPTLTSTKNCCMGWFHRSKTTESLRNVFDQSKAIHVLLIPPRTELHSWKVQRKEGLGIVTKLTEGGYWQIFLFMI
jgi:hypothetical protein